MRPSNYSLSFPEQMVARLHVAEVVIRINCSHQTCNALLLPAPPPAPACAVYSIPKMATAFQRSPRAAYEDKASSLICSPHFLFGAETTVDSSMAAENKAANFSSMSGSNFKEAWMKLVVELESPRVPSGL